MLGCAACLGLRWSSRVFFPPSSSWRSRSARGPRLKPRTPRRPVSVSWFLDDRHNLINWNILQFANNAAWKGNSEAVDLSGAGEPEVSFQSVLGEIGGLAPNFLILLLPSCFDLNFCPKAASVALRRAQPDFQPVVLVSSVIAQQKGMVIVVHHKNIHVPVVVEIREGCSSAHVQFTEDRTADLTDLVEAVVRALLPKKEILHRGQTSRVFLVLEGAAARGE